MKSILTLSLSVAVAFARFSPNVRIGHGSRCYYPAITVGPLVGQAQPLYVAIADGPNTVFQKSTDAGTTWLEADQVVCQGGTPDLTTDPDGNIYIVCDRAGHVYCIGSTDGGETWSPPVRVDDNDTAVGIGWARVAADTAGNLLCAWNDFRTGSGHIWSSVSTDGGTTWRQNVLVDDDTTDSDCFKTDVYVQPGTNHYLVAAEVPGDGTHPCLYRSTDMGQTFQPRVRLDTGSGSAGTPHVIADRAHIICDYHGYDIAARTFYTQSDTWGSPRHIYGSNYHGGKLAISADGRAHTALMAFDSICGRYLTLYTFSSDHGVSWSEPEPVNDDSTRDNWDPDIGADSAGTVYVVWQDWRDGIPEIWFSTNNTAGVVERSLQTLKARTLATISRRLPLDVVAFDAMGRRVLHPKPGIYFLKTGTDVVPRKVLLVE